MNTRIATDLVMARMTLERHGGMEFGGKGDGNSTGENVQLMIMIARRHRLMSSLPTHLAHPLATTSYAVYIS